jgi:hypothetical protein
MEALRRKEDRTFAFVLTLVFAAWVLFVAFHHEPWRDEADGWLAARDMTPRQLFRWLGGAGTPGLWYAMLMPFAKLGFAYPTMTFLHAGLAIVTAALVAFCAPFSRLFKALFVFSYYMVYEYAVVARSYVLTVLLLVLLAMALTGKARRMWLIGLLLFLLFNANVHGFLIAGIFSVALAVDAIRRRDLSADVLVGAALALAGGLLAFAQLLPSPDAQVIGAGGPQWVVAGDAISHAFFPQLPAYPGAYFRWAHGRAWAAWPMYYGVRCFGAAVFLAVLFFARRSALATFVTFASALAVLYVCVFKWFGGPRHAGLLWALLLFVLWASRWPLAVYEGEDEMSMTSRLRRLTRGGLAFSLACGVIAAVLWSYRDVRFAYSDSKQMAGYIKSHGLESRAIVGWPVVFTEPVLPYLPKTRFWNVGLDAYGTYMTWDRKMDAERHMKPAEVLHRVRRAFPNDDYLLLVASEPLEDPQAAGYRLMYQTDGRIFDGNAVQERYFLYAPEHSK